MTARRLLALTAGVLGLAAPSADATNINVTTTADAVTADGRCSLREAISSANADAAPFADPGECAAGNGPDAIAVPAGQYTRSASGFDDNNTAGDLDITSVVTITGAGGAATTIDANSLDRVLDVRPGATFTIQNVTLTGGVARAGADRAAGIPGDDGEPGGGIRNEGTLTVIDCVVVGNRAGSGGSSGTVTGSAGTTGPTGGTGGPANGAAGGAGGDGGGIFSSGALTLMRATLATNTAGTGGRGGNAQGGPGGGGTSGAGGNGGNAQGGQGGSGGIGGGLRKTLGSTAVIDQSTFRGNTGGTGGFGGDGLGGIGNVGQTVGGVGGNGTGGPGGNGGRGGGISAENPMLTVRTSLIAANTTGAGSHGGSGTGGAGGPLFGSSGNGGNGGNGTGGFAGSGGSGGGVNALDITYLNDTIADNATGDGGVGGVGNGGKGGGTLSTGTTGNGGTGTGGQGGAGGAAGGIAANGLTPIRHLTLTGNSVGAGNFGGSASGGGAGQPGSGGTTGSPGGAAGGTFGNEGTIGGMLMGSGATLTLDNSIVAGNEAPSCGGFSATGSHSLVFPDATCPATTANPLLGPLADNGGPTLTRRPGDGSPAIDAVPASGAGCPETDQRGVSRPRGAGCEIGAYERAAPFVAITAAAATAQGTVTPNAGSATYHFEFGTTTDYGSSTANATAGGVEPVAVSADLPGLSPGTTYHVRLVAANPDGTTASADATFTTAAAPPGGGGGSDTTAPVILSASVKPKTFRRRHGTTFRYRLSEDARVVFTIKPRKGKAKRLSKASKAGPNKRKLVTRKLKPGRYRATLVATDAAKNRSKPKRLTFRIKR